MAAISEDGHSCTRVYRFVHSASDSCVLTHLIDSDIRASSFDNTERVDKVQYNERRTSGNESVRSRSERAKLKAQVTSALQLSLLLSPHNAASDHCTSRARLSDPQRSSYDSERHVFCSCGCRGYDGSL